MVKKLKRRLTLLFTVLTSGVLVVVVSIALLGALQQNTQNYQDSFFSDNEAVISRLSSNIDSGSLIGQMEQEKGAIIDVSVNGKAIEITGQIVSEEIRQSLLIQANEKIEAEEYTLINHTVQRSDDGGPAGGSIGGYTEQSAIRPIPVQLVDSNGDKYWSILSSVVFLDGEEAIPDYDSIHRVLFIKGIEEMGQNATRLKVKYIALMLLGILLLGIINRLLTKIALKPILENMREQKEFIAAASHELRNPLAVILNSVHLAKTTEQTIEKDLQLDRINNETVRISRLVNDLLVLAGSESGRWNIAVNRVELDTLLIEASEQYALLGQQKNIKVKLEMPNEPLGIIDGDADRLMQVLRILIENAVQYSPCNSVIGLAGSKSKNHIKISVTDSGAGIPDNEKSLVFNRFYQSDVSRSKKEHFGLGLSVAKELVEIHGGNIHIEDTPAGGTTVIIRFPRSVVHEN